MQVADRAVRFAVETVRMDDGGGGGTSNDPLATVTSEAGGGANVMPAVSTVYVTIPQAGTIVSGSKSSFHLFPFNTSTSVPNSTPHS
ncbi:hypothetical protein GWK47_007211 [Chionoecetes opilio]|uniref:Uncharacterized protein n=1 Tax=Chionoecetes opilio TaxID=41210 RepID=A0A8J4Y1T1_CHIOP|nr:hypothetical protein GWK47_007211 [Chionoecetes opilio]